MVSIVFVVMWVWSVVTSSWMVVSCWMIGYEVDVFKCGVRPYTISRSKLVYLYMLHYRHYDIM